MTTVPTVDTEMEIVPEAGHRGVDTRDDFVTKQENYQDAQRITFQPQLEAIRSEVNTSIGAMNSLASEIHTLAIQAETAKDIAVGASNYEGEWVAGYATTGYSQGMSVSIGDDRYISKVDNNLVEPTTKTTTTEWLYIQSGFSHKDITTTYTASANEYLKLNASGGIFTVTLDNTLPEDTEVILLGIDVETNNVSVVDSTDANIVTTIGTYTELTMNRNNIETKVKKINNEWRVL